MLSALVLLVLALMTGSDTSVHAAPDPTVEAIQRALVEREFDPGEVDGAMGWRTRGALRVFQRSVGLPDSGRTDDATLKALGLRPPGDAPVQAPSTDAPNVGTPSPKPAAAPDTDTPAADTPRERTGQVPAAKEAESESARANPAIEPSADVSGTESPEPKQAPKRTTRPKLSFATLGWHPPQTGEDALERLNASGAPRDFKRGKGSLFVPNTELLFVLKAGETVPGFDCDPGTAELSVEFVFGPDGPVIFNPVSGGEYCQVGIGIALEVGRTMEMRRVDWGGTQFPHGTVRITHQGLEYVR